MSKRGGVLSQLRGVFGLGPQTSPPAPGAQEGFVMVSVSEPDAALEQAIVAAQKTVLFFLQRLASHPQRLMNYSLKVGFPTDHGPEYLWLFPVELDGDRMKGVLMHDPVFLRGKRQGSKVSFRLSQIIDWAIQEDDVVYGHFTTRVLFKAHSEANDDLADSLSEDPLPPDAHAWLAQEDT